MKAIKANKVINPLRIILFWLTKHEGEEGSVGGLSHRKLKLQPTFFPPLSPDAT